MAEDTNTGTLGSKLLNGWQAERVLGSGDFAEVFLVQRGEERGALKLATANNHGAIERLNLEVQALAKLNHDAIPKLIENGASSDAPYFVMTLAKGRSLLSIVDDWSKRGRVFGHIEVLRYLVNILGALSHMHAAKLVHRDIKDANVILDEAGHDAMLIDFGFCKRAGTSELRDKDSFWRAGAARFAPPGKLDDPALAVETHDVFAVGVLAYRMLTGMYPWSVGPKDGLRAYKDQVTKQPLVAPHNLNGLLPVDVSRLVTQMLQLEDEQRILTSEAFESAVHLIDTHDGTPRCRSPNTITTLLRHVVRDPLRGDIRLSHEEYEIVNSKEMQRLRWIRQLGLTNLVYPGADHSRLSHAIGTMERAEFMLTGLEASDGARLDPDLRREVRLYALVHDYSHVALGHALEDQLGIFERHDANKGRFERLIERPESELGKLLRSSTTGQSIIARLDPSSKELDDAVNQFVSGFIGADVLDYLDRDAYYCGLNHRVDSAIFRQIRLYARDDERKRKVVSLSEGKYGLRADRDYAIETILTERYAMFMKVYSHSTKLAADAVLGKMLSGATTGRSKLSEADIEWLGDESLILRCSVSKKVVVAECAGRLRYRRLPAAVFRARVIDSKVELDARAYNDQLQWASERGFSNPDKRSQTENELAKKARVDANHIFLYTPISAPGYNMTSLWEQETSAHRPANRTPASAHEISRRHLDLWTYWVFLADGTENEKRRVAEAAEDVFGMPNGIEEYRRALI